MKILKSKKIVSLFLVLMLALGVFALAGCTPEGNEYLKLTREMSTLENYTMSGSMDMSMDFGALTAEMSAPELAMFKDIKVTYNASADMKNNVFEMKTTMKMGNNPALPLDMYMKGSTILVNAEQFVKLLEVSGGTAAKAEIDATKKALAGVTWLNLDGTMSMMPTNINFTALTNTIYDFMDYLNANSFKDYQPKVFAKKSNGYEMNISATQLAPITNEFLTYVLTHSQAIVNDVKAYVAKADSSLFDALGISKADVTALLDLLPASSAELTPAELADMQKLITEMAKYIDGTTVNSYVGKLGDKKYEQTMDMVMNFVDPAKTTNKIGIKMKMNATIDGTKAVTVNYPTTGVQSTSKLAAGVSPKSVLASIQLANGSAMCIKSYEVTLFNSMKMNKVDVLSKDGSTYLPMRQVGELLGETVGWENNAAYVLQGDKKVKIEGIQSNNTTFVKVREFEKIGYTVEYDAALGMVTLTKGFEATASTTTPDTVTAPPTK